MLSQEDFVFRSNLIHNNKYDYSNSIYLGYESRIKILCHIHGEFIQRSQDHIQGSGCQKCAADIRVRSSTKDNAYFLKRSKEMYGDFYTYLDEYENQHKQIRISCPKHGIFLQKPKYHVAGYGCKECGKMFKGKIKSKDQFMELCNEIHNNKYDYSELEFVFIKNKGKIKCPKHGEFYQKLESHTRGIGCPKCSSSKAELVVIKYLSDRKINFTFEKTFDDCLYERKLYFDFYLPEHNLCIECDGRQHFESIEWFGGEETLEKNKIRDSLKNNFCLDNGIELLRIRYDENIIEKLENILNKNKN